MKVGSNPRQAQRPGLCSLLIERRCWQLYNLTDGTHLDRESWQGIKLFTCVRKVPDAMQYLFTCVLEAPDVIRFVFSCSRKAPDAMQEVYTLYNTISQLNSGSSLGSTPTLRKNPPGNFLIDSVAGI